LPSDDARLAAWSYIDDIVAALLDVTTSPDSIG
jgi:hypothetical protein